MNLDTYFGNIEISVYLSKSISIYANFFFFYKSVPVFIFLNDHFKNIPSLGSYFSNRHVSYLWSLYLGYLVPMRMMQVTTSLGSYDTIHVFI